MVGSFLENGFFFLSSLSWRCGSVWWCVHWTIFEWLDCNATCLQRWLLYIQYFYYMMTPFHSTASLCTCVMETFILIGCGSYFVGKPAWLGWSYFVRGPGQLRWISSYTAVLLAVCSNPGQVHLFSFFFVKAWEPQICVTEVEFQY